MIREEIKKYVKYSQIIRQKIQKTENIEMKKILYKELANTYCKIDFYRRLLYAMYKQTYGSKKGDKIL